MANKEVGEVERRLGDPEGEAGTVKRPGSGECKHQPRPQLDSFNTHLAIS